MCMGDYNMQVCVCVCRYLCVAVVSQHTSSTEKTSSDKIYHLNISGSVVTLLQMAPRAAAVSRMRNFTLWHASAGVWIVISSIFTAVSGIDNATRRGNLLRKKTCRRSDLWSGAVRAGFMDVRVMNHHTELSSINCPVRINRYIFCFWIWYKVKAKTWVTEHVKLCFSHSSHSFLFVLAPLSLVTSIHFPLWYLPVPPDICSFCVSARFQVQTGPGSSQVDKAWVRNPCWVSCCLALSASWVA